MKKAYIVLICFCFVLCCTFGVMLFREIMSPSAANATENSSVQSEQDISLAAGKAAVLSADDNRTTASDWRSDNEDVVTVDNGGRIDAHIHLDFVLSLVRLYKSIGTGHILVSI